MKKRWWHDKIAYQIYPKSFFDSNGDGIGDVRGILEKLDYLKELGVDILWLSPIYLSPLADEGYDIADYYEIDPRFGTLADVDELIAEAKKRDMYVLMDLVVNHCSDEHEWFRRACADPDGPYAGYFYIFRKNEDGSVPTNWRAFFGGSAWEDLPGHPELCYLHYFHKKQPDLNWENPALVDEVYRNIEWWLNRGLAGFRIDAISYIQKPEVFHDYPADREDGLASVAATVPDSHGLEDKLRDMKHKLFDKYDAFTVGEVCHVEEERLPSFVGEDGCFSSVFDFEEDTFGFSPNGWYDRTPCLPEDYKACVFRAQDGPGRVGFLSNIIENHDEARGVSRYIPKEELSDTSKKALAAAYFLLRGIPFIYQGQEIGMENHVFRSPDEFSDVNAFAQYNAAIDAGCTKERALEAVSDFSRDNARTPMQWSDAENAGFTTGTPWLFINEKYRTINVAANEKDPDSVLHFYQELIRLRKDPELKETFVYGEVVPYLPEVKNLMAYIRKGTPEVLVTVNMQMEESRMPLPEREGGWEVCLNNLHDVKTEGNVLILKPWQAVVLK